MNTRILIGPSTPAKLALISMLLIAASCTGNGSVTDCSGPDCEEPCTGPECEPCMGPDCEPCTGPECEPCMGPDCEPCMGPDCEEPAAHVLSLPVEVFGDAGATSARTLHVADPASVARLYVRGHALGYQLSELAETTGYDKKASYRINGGDWIDIDNATAELFHPEASYEGIGGPWHTLRMYLPAPGIVAGENDIEFRFNGTEGISIGYRIVELDLQREDGTTALDDTAIVEDDPDTWLPPLDNESDIAAGEALWHQRNVLVESPLDGFPLVAACSDCHATDGRDLKYFNYSNESIVERSVFHGLSETEGQQIASFIRTIDLELPSGLTVADLGRPWNPPYQPGPGLDAKPVEAWAAGAGVDWVLDDDVEMVSHLFPDGTDPAAVTAVAHPDASLNSREIPLALQFPDWNHWLPHVYPGDVLGEEAFHESEAYQLMTVTIIDQLESDRAGMIDQARQWVENGGVGSSGLVHMYGAHTGYQFRDGANYPASEYPIDSRWEGAEKIDDISFQQWMLVKQWEQQQRYKLEELGDAIHVTNSEWVTGGNNRAWIPQTSSPFNVGPHKNSRPEYPHVSPYPTPEQNMYFTTVWYELQSLLTLNRVARGTSTVDWNYHHPHIGEVASVYGHGQTLRWLKAQILVQQHRSNGTGLDERYWRWHDVDPARILIGYKWSDVVQRYPNQDELTDIAAGVLDAWLIQATRYQPREYFLHDEPARVQTPSYTPTDNGDYPNMATTAKPDEFYRLVARLADRGADTGVLERAARFGESMWPNGDWERWYE